MGELRSKFRLNQRSVVLSAALILPFSSAAAVVSLSPGAQGATMSLAAGTISSPSSQGRLTGLQVAKTAPLATLATGRGPVVVGSISQRVRQVSAMSSYDVPVAALDAYHKAAASLALSASGCHLSWTILAAIGTVESDNGQYGGAVVMANGDTSPHILGPVLNGTGGVGAIRDSDSGRLDGDTTWDRAVGPMQFIPGTWAAYGADGNGDGVQDPNNIYDAALAAARYLCAAGGDMLVPSQARAAIMRYNYSVAYVDLVLRLARAYAHGAGTIVPNGPSGGDQTTPPAHHPPAHRGNGGKGGNGGNGGHGGNGGNGGNGGGQQPPVDAGPRQGPPVATSPPVKPGPVVSGTLVPTATGWCVGTTPLDLGAGADLGVLQGDYNLDGQVQSVALELASLEGRSVALTLLGTPISNEATSPCPATAPTGMDAAAKQPEAVVPVVIGTDGVVTSINDLLYAVIPTQP